MSGRQDSPACIAFDGPAIIRNVEAMHERLMHALAQHTSVHIDCSAIDSVDVSFLQLLLAARRSAQQAGKKLSLHPPPADALYQALLRGGFVQPDADNDPFWSGVP